MDAENQRPWKAICGDGLSLNQELVEYSSYPPWPGCIRNIPVPNSSGGGAVQIGYPADLSGIHAVMTRFSQNEP
jgi:hypothetical protein